MAGISLVSMLLLCLIVMATAMPPFLHRRSSQVNEDDKGKLYEYLKRAVSLKSRLNRYNSNVNRRALLDCKDNVKCMVWGKRNFSGNKDHKRSRNNFDNENYLFRY